MWQAVVPFPLLESMRPKDAALHRDKGSVNGRSCCSLPSIVGSKTALTGVCYWPSLRDSLTRMVAGTYPVGAGLGKAWYACEVSGRYARWVTFTETALLRGDGILVPNTYWGLLFGSIFVGRYAKGGAVCMFMNEVSSYSLLCPPPARINGSEEDDPGIPHACFEGGGESSEEDAVWVLKEGAEYDGIILWPGSVTSKLCFLQ